VSREISQHINSFSRCTDAGRQADRRRVQRKLRPRSQHERFSLRRRSYTALPLVNHLRRHHSTPSANSKFEKFIHIGCVAVRCRKAPRFVLRLIKVQMYVNMCGVMRLYCGVRRYTAARCVRRHTAPHGTVTCSELAKRRASPKSKLQSDLFCVEWDLKP